MKKKSLKGTLTVPGDKSISHRALIFSSLVEGETEIVNCSPALDCASSAECMQALGLQITAGSLSEQPVLVKSPGLFNLTAPKKPLYAGNSGTTMRLLSGLLAGQPFTSILDGDESLRKRPMARVLKPLEEMGAAVKYLKPDGLTGAGKNGGEHAPFEIQGKKLSGHEFNLKIASAQVQTAILLAGLQADGRTSVALPHAVRDHTRRMFQWLEVPCEVRGDTFIAVEKLKTEIRGKKIEVPADISSAAFMLVAAAIVPDSHIVLTNVGMNEGRLLVTDVLKRMGADLKIENSRLCGFEPVSDLRMKFHPSLHGVTVSGAEVATGIDEIPILALAGTLCEGTFVVRDASELKHKESDRLQAIVDNLSAAGAEIEGQDDGFVIKGKPTLRGGSYWHTFKDHRLAMMGLVANLICQEPLQLEETESVGISYPTFAQDLDKLAQ
jgi:3-phosphoshikimate 1-carboxyvinyltransferase